MVLKSYTVNFRVHYVISNNILCQDLSIYIYSHAVINHSQIEPLAHHTPE